MSEQEKTEQQKKELYYDPICQIEEPEDECDFNGEECINSFLHRHCGCVGCEVIAPPAKEELEETECCICQEKKQVDYEGYCQQCHDEIAARNVRDGSK